MNDSFITFADQLFKAIEGYVGRRIEPLLARLGTLEKRAPEPGPPGKDASPEDIAAAVSAAVAQIPRPKDGVDGKSVEPDEVQRMVARAVEALPTPRDGIDGPPGPRGQDGRDGMDGRDATLIDPIPEIDETRSYARGTWAKHLGGLWLARGVTVGMVGWDCIIDGIAGFDVSGDEHGRDFVAVLRSSSGLESRHEFHVPALIYRGVWRESEVYTQGDATTRDGSVWMLTTPKQAGKPGSDGSGWQLAVKKGTDGRAGIRGDKGERGAEGRPGRDLTQMTLDGRKY